MFAAGLTLTDEVTFRDADGNLYDPTTVTLEVRNPDGSLIYPMVAHVSTGIWRGNFTLNRGITRWEWDGTTGSVHDVVVGSACAAEAVTV